MFNSFYMREFFGEKLGPKISVMLYWTYNEKTQTIRMVTRGDFFDRFSQEGLIRMENEAREKGHVNINGYIITYDAEPVK